MKNNFKKIINSKLFKNGMWLTILQLVNTVIPVVTIPYVTRILGSNEYGIFSIALNWILYLQVLVEYGFGLSGSRKVALLKENEHAQLNQLFNNIISARILLLIVSFVALNIICIISAFSLQMYISILILFIMIIGTTFQLTWLFQGKQDMKFITIINVTSRIVSVILIFLLVKKPNDIYLYCALYSITLFLSSVISMIVARKKYNLKFSFARFDAIIKEFKDGIYLFASSAMTKIFSGFGVTMLGIYTTASITGIFSAIYKIPYVLTMFFSPVSQAIYPFISKEFSKGDEEGKKCVRKIGIPIFIIFGIFSIFIIVFNKIIINLLFGMEYSNYSIIVVPLVIQFLLAIINNFIGIQTLVASGKQKNYSKAFAIGCIAIVASNVLLGKLYGIYGVSIAAPIGELVLTISLIFQLKMLERSEKND
ncbi:MAG: flippase [Clostridia bacterium]